MAVVVGVAIFFPEIFPTRGRAPIDIAVVDESVGTDGKGMVDVTYSGIDKEGRPFSLSAKGVRRVADNARVLLYDGRVLMEGQPSEIVDNQDVRRLYLGDRFSL
jgi:hypothetical protein